MEQQTHFGPSWTLTNELRRDLMKRFFVMLLASVMLGGCSYHKSDNSSPTAPGPTTFSITLKIQGENPLDLLHPIPFIGNGYATILGKQYNTINGVVSLGNLYPNNYTIEVGSDMGFGKTVIEVSVVDKNVTQTVTLKPVDEWHFVRAWTTNAQGVETKFDAGATIPAPTQLHTMWQVWYKDPADTLISAIAMNQGTPYTTNGSFYGLIRGDGALGSKMVEVFHKDYRPCQIPPPTFAVQNCQSKTDAFLFRWVHNSNNKEYASSSMPFVINWNNPK
jgi:hypothetical protein